MRPQTSLLALALASSAILAAPLAAQTSERDRDARAILAELIGINTTAEHGSSTPAAHAVARRLLAAGFPEGDVAVVGPDTLSQNV
ncbi:MAG TPA: hypothetical protein VLD58_16530, partial [Gemmatimonadales bacterium]|nr:hypothetical protein [Gemmatimonadales bacterium]